MNTPKTTIYIAIIYICFSLLYFSPLAINHKIAFPLAFLSISSLFLSPRNIMLAMIFSTLGDFMGSCGNFWGQMGFFFLAHVSFLIFFYQTYRQNNPREYDNTVFRSFAFKTKTFCIILFAVLTFISIISKVSPISLQCGTALYALIISCMLWASWLQQDKYFFWGAFLFVFSDTILAWNKFVEPVYGSHYLIMIPYYGGQLILFIRSVKTAR